MKNVFYCISIVLLLSFSSDKPAYKLFKNNGKETKYSKLLEKASKADIVFFGELHTDPIAHWLQLELTKDLFTEKDTNLILGAEMFEADGQLILDEYLQGQISKNKFENEMRLWSNYSTDYKPLVELAKKKKIDFIATNIPRRYASKVFKEGLTSLGSLSNEAKKHIAPLPISFVDTLLGYKKLNEMTGMGGHASQNLAKAQAIKDATMAHFILENLESGKTFVHYNGAYHTNNFEGIIWYIQQKKPNLKILTITTVQQDNIDKLEKKYEELANFILCVPSSMTQTHR